MKSTMRFVVAVCCAATGLIAGTSAVRAEVLDWTAAALTTGALPDSAPIIVLQSPDLGIAFPLAVDVQSSQVDPSITTATASLIASSNSPGTEIVNGAGTATVDPVLFNNSSVGSRSRASTGDTVFPGDCLCLSDASIGGLSATLSNPLGGGATVDLTLHVHGSLVLQDPGGTAGVAEVCDPFDDTSCELVSDMSANVVVLLALAPVVSIDDPFIFADPGSLPFTPLFNGSATLELQDIEGTITPVLVGSDDWASAFPGDGVFSTVGTCDRFSCEIAVDFTKDFLDVQSLGFGDQFDVGLMLVTLADGVSAEGRVMDSNFLDTASLSLVFNPSQVPAPASLPLLAVAFLVMAAVRWRRLLH